MIYYLVCMLYMSTHDHDFAISFYEKHLVVFSITSLLLSPYTIIVYCLRTFWTQICDVSKTVTILVGLGFSKYIMNLENQVLNIR